MRGASYHEMQVLSHFYLEDSYLLAIHIFPGILVFRVEAVVTNTHPAYTDPVEGEKYCYRMIDIVFNDISSIEEFSVKFSVATDANDEKDMGNIDSLTVSEGNRIHITGPWGSAQFVSNCVEVNLLAAQHGRLNAGIALPKRNGVVE